MLDIISNNIKAEKWSGTDVKCNNFDGGFILIEEFNLKRKNL